MQASRDVQCWGWTWLNGWGHRSPPVSSAPPCLSCPGPALALCQIQGHGTFRRGRRHLLGQTLQHLCAAALHSALSSHRHSSLASTVHTAQIQTVTCDPNEADRTGRFPLSGAASTKSTSLASKLHALPARKSHLVGAPADELPALQQTQKPQLSIRHLCFQGPHY
jgi:hypothetical protein